MLTDLNLLNLLPQAGTVPGAILADDADLLRPLRLHASAFVLGPGQAIDARDQPRQGESAGGAECATLHPCVAMLAVECAADGAGTQHAVRRTMASPAEAVTQEEEDGWQKRREGRILYPAFTHWGSQTR